jgi:hypothetical protein
VRARNQRRKAYPGTCKCLSVTRVRESSEGEGNTDPQVSAGSEHLPGRGIFPLQTTARGFLPGVHQSNLGAAGPCIVRRFPQTKNRQMHAAKDHQMPHMPWWSSYEQVVRQKVASLPGHMQLSYMIKCSEDNHYTRSNAPVIPDHMHLSYLATCTCHN